jgi:hypothetical protein
MYSGDCKSEVLNLPVIKGFVRAVARKETKEYVKRTRKIVHKGMTIAQAEKRQKRYR